MASVPEPLIGSTVKAALLTAAGQTAAARIIAAAAVVLMERMVRNMAILKLKLAAAILLGTGIMMGLSYHGLAEQATKPASGTGVSPVSSRAPAAVLTNAKPAAAKEAAEQEKNAVTVKEMPPVVVRTVPQSGDTEVDADKIKEIRVTFSKDMMDKSWSWTQISNETFPKTDGEVHYDKDRRTCVLPVKLEAGKTYVLWLNSARFGNFKDADGNSAVPYLLVFETKPKK